MPRSPRVEDAASLPVEAVDVSSIDGGIPFPTFDAEEQRRQRRGSRGGIWNEINASRAGRGPIIKEVSHAVTAPHLCRPLPFLARHLLTTLAPPHRCSRDRDRHHLRCRPHQVEPQQSLAGGMPSSTFETDMPRPVGTQSRPGFRLPVSGS